MSTMDEASWEGRSFQLPIKRSRPITPIEENQDFGGWTNGVNITFNDMGYDYEITRELSASWASAPQMEKFKPAGSDGAKTRPQMRTGCIPCLLKGIPCDPQNRDCKKAISTDWNVNYEGASDTLEQSTSLSLIRPDTKWRRSWRERHSLNFFVYFSAPQMAGFFDSDFWNRLVIRTSYHEPAILHAITAIGALHESILQRAFADEKRKAKAMEFALAQCNKSIAELTSSQSGPHGMGQTQTAPNPRLALTTCVLFTCFEALQGRCDSAVSHALQGRRLLQATEKPSNPTSTSSEESSDLENMRPIVERLEVQATALLDKGRRPSLEQEYSAHSPPLPLITHPHSLDHAHNMLHSALNSVMRSMQTFQPTASRDRIAHSMHEKYTHYVPWFAGWEEVFTAYLAANRETMSAKDIKRAMVLKANHLVGSMLASVDQSAGPTAYDAYEVEFRAIVDLSREVLASFSCPPLPTLTGGNSGTPYLSFSLWVTDPLWMAISRCRNPSIRQAAFGLLSQNPRQEGIWHAGPMVSMGRLASARKEGGGGSAGGEGAARKKGVGQIGGGGSIGAAAVGNKRKKTDGDAARSVTSSSRTASLRPSGSPGDEAAASTPARSRAESRGTSQPSSARRPLEQCETRVKDEWLDMLDRVENYDRGQQHDHQDCDGDCRIQALPGRYKSHCQGRCSIPYLEDLRRAEAGD